MTGRKGGLTGFLTVSSFLAPSLIGFIVFLFGPMVASIIFSLNDWNILSPMKFVGLGNYTHLLHDKLWWTSLGNTFWYSLLNIPLVIAVSIVFALVVTRRGRLSSTIFRTIYFLPVVVSEVAVAIMWKWILSTNYGFLNAGLESLGLPKVGWLTDGRVA
ncbi:MAG TPA: sugar ABC transporter permease, partial [Spirochaetia bacterium]|nr:sugar ABC transporter permease [Spirochaetia bacterium]